MPCYSGDGPGATTVYVETGKNAARLCAVFSVLEDRGLLEGVLRTVNWDEAGEGVTYKSTVAWWERHKRADAERLAREAEAKRVREAKLRVLSKLTDEEIKLLNLRKP